uniref:Transmembrane protein n=1 Tax=Physcomitrium patens TaxID=3218 RepID=A0A7I4DU31_PHYPA
MGSTDQRRQRDEDFRSQRIRAEDNIDELLRPIYKREMGVSGRCCRFDGALWSVVALCVCLCFPALGSIVSGVVSIPVRHFLCKRFRCIDAVYHLYFPSLLSLLFLAPFRLALIAFGPRANSTLPSDFFSVEIKHRLFLY